MSETQAWQAMMHSCRRACHIIGEDFREPEYLNWYDGREYHKALWIRVKTLT